MAKRKITLTQPTETVIETTYEKYLFKVGKEYYLRMMPTPFKNVKPKLPKP
jgi:hypothetical protein